MIEWLESAAIGQHVAMHASGATHPMRVVTRRAAGIESGGWDDSTREEVRRLFGGLAGEWHTRTSPERAAVVGDALARGLPPGRQRGTVVEPGSGTGAYSSQLAERWDRALAVELTPEMLTLAPPAPSHRVLADASLLPLADGSVTAVVLVNMFLFPNEVDRVLAPGGVLVWVNSSGENTPIHLMPEEVAEVLPGAWSGVAAHAGVGLWAVLHRAADSRD